MTLIGFLTAMFVVFVVFALFVIIFSLSVIMKHLGIVKEDKNDKST